MSETYQLALKAPPGLIRRAGLIYGYRAFAVGHWYAPRKPGPAKKARFLREFRHDGINEDWVVYEVLDNGGQPVTRSCTVGVWCRWAGERLAEL